MKYSSAFLYVGKSSRRTHMELLDYPKEVALCFGTEVALRPMTPRDALPLERFFSKIPAGDRYYLKEYVTSAEVVQRWVAELYYDRVLPLLAWVGELRILADPEDQNRGLGPVMLREPANLAHENGLERSLEMRLVV